MKWRDEMREQFGLEFRIVDSTSMQRAPAHARGPARTAVRALPAADRVDRLAEGRPRDAAAARGSCLPSPELDPRRFDLLIVDEVHNVRPPARGSAAQADTLHTQAIRELAPHFEHRLFLSATPHNGYRESFAALLELLDPQRFAR